jgi:hypothetical protein
MMVDMAKSVQEGERKASILRIMINKHCRGYREDFKIERLPMNNILAMKMSHAPSNV